MTMELIVTAVIGIAAIYIFYKNLKKKAQGKCDCGSCSNHCPHYKDSNK